jgi:phenylacetate-CoA ligase
MKLTPLEPWIHEEISSSQPVLTRREIETWQLKRLNETLALARKKSSFYHKHFLGLPETIKSLDELHQFPFTTSEDIRRNPLRFVCVSQDDIQRVVTLQSSGTTGTPKRIYFTPTDQELTIDFFGVGMSTLVEAGQHVLILLPGQTPGSVGDLLRMGLERKGVHTIPYGMVKDPFHALDVMENWQANCLVGSPTQILSLARRWNPSRRAPRTILLSTDYVPAAIVRELEKIWGCEVFNHYGATEMGLGGGVECEAHRGYHLREADLYFEIVHPETGERVPEGEYGEIVFSTLTRRGMPLIRYRTGDRSRFIAGDCPCGTKLRTMEKVCGRFGGFVRVGDDTLMLPNFDERLFPIAGMLNFSITVAGSKGNEALFVEAQMLPGEDSAPRVEKALISIPAIKNLKTIVRCVNAPNEAGSLVKRVIVDKRG